MNLMKTKNIGQSDSPQDFLVNASTDVLRQTLAEVERDEAEAIETLCSLLETIESSRDFSSLAPIRDVVKQWQSRPPGGIVTDLKRIGETLKCPARENT